MNSTSCTISIRLNFQIYETWIPLYQTVMVPETFTQLIIKSLPLVTSVIHLGTGSLILQPIIGSFNNTYWTLCFQSTVTDCIVNKRANIQGVQLPRHNI